MSERILRKRGFCIYQETEKNTSRSSFDTTRKKRRPLKEKSCNLSTLFSSTTCIKSATTAHLSPIGPERTLLSAFATDMKLSSQRVKDQNARDDIAHFDTLLRDCEVAGPSPEAVRGNTAKGTYHLRQLPQILNTDTRRSSSLVNGLSRALSNFSARVQISRLERRFDLLLVVEHMSLLSPHEIIVSTRNSNNVKQKDMILHSTEPLGDLAFKRLLRLKLAVNSKCYLELCNDMIWYLRWKFF